MFTGMRVLIGTMIRSVPMIANVMLFCVFFFTIFGIFGLQVFMGTLRNRCFTVVTETSCAADHAETRTRCTVETSFHLSGMISTSPPRCSWRTTTSRRARITP